MVNRRAQRDRPTTGATMAAEVDRCDGLDDDLRKELRDAVAAGEIDAEFVADLQYFGHLAIEGSHTVVTEENARTEAAKLLESMPATDAHRNDVDDEAMLREWGNVIVNLGGRGPRRVADGGSSL